MPPAHTPAPHRWPRRALLIGGPLAAVGAIVGANVASGDFAGSPLERLFGGGAREAVPGSAVRLPPELQRAAAPVREAYTFALQRPDVLRYMACTCGCADEGHTSNLDCFVQAFHADGSVTLDAHGSTWDVCVEVARDAKRLTEQGRSLRETRAEVDRRWGSVGKPTNTPLPPG